MKNLNFPTDTVERNCTLIWKGAKFKRFLLFSPISLILSNFYSFFLYFLAFLIFNIYISSKLASFAFLGSNWHKIARKSRKSANMTKKFEFTGLPPIQWSAIALRSQKARNSNFFNYFRWFHPYYGTFNSFCLFSSVF